MKRYPFIMRRVGALHLFFDGFISQNAFFQQFSIFPLFLHNVILLALMFKSWYKANAVWHKLLMKKGTLLSISSVTSKTFIASKVYIFGNSGRICQKAYNLPFVHAKFQRTGSSYLASTLF